MSLAVSACSSGGEDVPLGGQGGGGIQGSGGNGSGASTGVGGGPGTSGNGSGASTGVGGGPGMSGNGGAGVGGSPGTSGKGGAGGTVQGKRADKIDLLFVIDNSASMLDKQKILATAVPDLLGRLINPTCIDPATMQAVLPQPAGPLQSCPSGAEREFSPIDDIHIGILSSSLGGHGTISCSSADTTKGQNDRGQLVTRKASNIYDNSGFFFWDPSGKKAVMGKPAGLADAKTLKDSFTEAIKGVDQKGCGFESTLESMYRFLIEPNPPEASSNSQPMPEWRGTRAL